LASPNEEITLHQGRFLGRPSEIRVQIEGAAGDAGDAGEIAAVYVTGDVRMVARGVFE
jgi:predicted PhzF superfamily epimerase YddE/YHI9